MEFDKIVATDVSTEVFEVIVGKMGDQSRKTWAVEEVLADGGAVSGHDALFVTVHEVVEAIGQQTIGIASEEVVP